jgi:quinol monooxygenase YgiN
MCPSITTHTGEDRMSRFGLYTRIVARAGQRDALVEVLVDAAAALQPVADCALYFVNTVATEPDTVWVTEVWSSAEAHQAYLATDEFKVALGRGRPLIEGVSEQIAIVPVGGKGLPASHATP